MPEITMCNNHQCPLRMSCYRHTAKQGDIQAWNHFSPRKATIVTVEKVECDYFMAEILKSKNL